MHLHCDPISDVATRFALLNDESAGTWVDLLHGWRDPVFATEFSNVLANLPDKAYRWECPGLTIADLQKPCEFVAVSDPSLDRTADQSAFAEHFSDHATATFTNLGRDAVLVVPSHDHAEANYAHLVSFLRTAPAEQRSALWAAAAAAVEERLSKRALYLSTAGGGVPWLHVRLDDRPKYYSHRPYRST